MSNIVILGITGRVGSRIANELLDRGHTVTGIARSIAGIKSRNGLTLKAGDATKIEEVAFLLQGHDAVVSSMRFAGGRDAETVVDAVKRAKVPRLLVVGGAGSLEVAPGLALIDTPGFPAAYKPEAMAGFDFLNMLRGERQLNWTFLSPSALFEPGARTGKFRIGGNQLLSDGAGVSRITMEDYAIALVDEIESPKHLRERFTVGY